MEDVSPSSSKGKRSRVAKRVSKGGFLLIKGETFPYDVLVCIGVTPQEVVEYADKRFEDCFTRKEREDWLEKFDDGVKAKGRVTHLDNNAYVLWCKYLPKTPEEFGYLAHEIFHVADLMLRRAGLELVDGSDEAWSYHIDWFTRKIYKAFNLV